MEIFWFVCVFVAGLIIGFLIGAWAERTDMRKELIKQGCGRYDSKTGKFIVEKQ